MRAYAADKLAAAGGTAAAQRSHRDAFLARALEILADEQRDYLTGERFRRLDSDYANFMAALEWSWAHGDHDAVVRLCAALRPYWYHSGHPEGCLWMERAAGVPVSSPAMASVAADARAGLAQLLRNFGGDTHGRAESLMAEAIQVAEKGGDAFAAAWARVEPPTSPWSPDTWRRRGNTSAERTRRSDRSVRRRSGRRSVKRAGRRWRYPPVISRERRAPSNIPWRSWPPRLTRSWSHTSWALPRWFGRTPATRRPPVSVRKRSLPPDGSRCPRSW